MVYAGKQRGAPHRTFDVLNFTINSHEDYLNSGYVPTYASPQWISSLKENSVKK